MFLLFSALYAIFFFGTGWAVHKTLNHKKLNEKMLEPPNLDTPEGLMAYLEACSVNEPEIQKLLTNFQTWLGANQLAPYQDDALKQLEAHKPVDIIVPDWYHNANATIPCEEHWKLFLEDLNSEQSSIDKINVIKHWMVDRAVSFTDKEFLEILKSFEDPEDRAEIRKLYHKSVQLVKQRKRDKAKEKAKVKKDG